MFRRKNMLLKITIFMIAVAPLAIESRISVLWAIGEPKIPQKFNR